MSYSEIVKAVFIERQVVLNKSHVSDWVDDRHHPYGSTYEIDLTPPPELAYVIGVSKGDGSVRVQKWNHRVRLRVIDKESAMEFDRCASSILGSSRRAITWLSKQGLWCEVLSVLLVRFLRGPFPRIVEAVTHEGCAAGFLRGFFDSEASMSGRSLDISNTNLKVMRPVRSLLMKARICTTGLRLAREGGRLVTKGWVCHANRDIYPLHVRPVSLPRIAEKLGFSVDRKRDALALALRVRHPLYKC